MRRSDLLRDAMMFAGSVGLSQASHDSGATDASVREALGRFVSAFDALDMKRFIACFSTDASAFTPTGDSHRIDGAANIEAFFLTVFDETRRTSGKSKPPYMKLEPRDLRIQSMGDVAIATFHLVEPDSSIHRRTFVYRRESGVLKIVHLHASNFPPQRR
jgi:ketosteroid isomerase-like protein